MHPIRQFLTHLSNKYAPILNCNFNLSKMSISVAKSLRSPSIRKKSTRRVTELAKTLMEAEKDDLKRFQILLQKYCENGPFPSSPSDIRTYLIRADGTITCPETDLNPEKSDHVPFVITKAYSNAELSLKCVTCQCSRVFHIKLFLALQQTLSHFPTLSCLRLDYCNLGSEHILILQSHLQSKRYFTELSLIGNPIKEENFHLLVQCGLKVLVLRLCKITEKGLKNLAKAFFECPINATTLTHLDLSSNMVFDEGCKHIASILRCNRTLRSLNLSDCKIGHVGMEVLASCFVKFPLDEEEIAFRRRNRLEYFRSLENSVSSLYGGSANKSMEGFALVEETIKKHPFLNESFPETGQIICKGNYTLENLKLAYNHLTKSSLDLLLKNLIEQSLAFGNDKGLQSLFLEGNCPEGDDAKAALQNLMASKKTRSKSSIIASARSSFRRRKSSAVGSVISAQ